MINIHHFWLNDGHRVRKRPRFQHDVWVGKVYRFISDLGSWDHKTSRSGRIHCRCMFCTYYYMCRIGNVVGYRLVLLNGKCTHKLKYIPAVNTVYVCYCVTICRSVDRRLPLEWHVELFVMDHVMRFYIEHPSGADMIYWIVGECVRSPRFMTMVTGMYGRM